VSPLCQIDARAVLPALFQFTSVGDSDRGSGFVIRGGGLFDLPNNVVSFDDFAEDAMFAVEPVGDCGGDEELRTC
jgi:hypothetical protein